MIAELDRIAGFILDCNSHIYSQSLDIIWLIFSEIIPPYFIQTIGHLNRLSQKHLHISSC